MDHYCLDYRSNASACNGVCWVAVVGVLTVDVAVAVVVVVAVAVTVVVVVVVAVGVTVVVAVAVLAAVSRGCSRSSRRWSSAKEKP